MTTFKALTSKDIRLALKHGTTISELMEEYGFSLEEELFSTISKLFTKGSDASKVISELKKNSKKKKSSREKKASEPTAIQTIAEAPSENVSTQETIDVISVEEH